MGETNLFSWLILSKTNTEESNKAKAIPMIAKAIFIFGVLFKSIPSLFISIYLIILFLKVLRIKKS